MEHSEHAHTAPLTEQQRCAVVTRAVSVVLSSGAGCGKTHVLTERYLSHLRQDGAEVGQIVAITFTDRAARQMRRRIRQAIVQHVHAAATDEEAATWVRHLRALETAPISTIHAFCGNILRQHAIEAGLDPRFNVLEEVLSVNLEAEALAACLQRLLTAQSATGEDLRQLVLLYGWRAVVEALSGRLPAWDESRWQKWLERDAAQVADEWQRYAREKLLPRYIDYLLRARPALARCLSLLRRHPPKPGPMAENVRFLLDELPRLAQAPDLAAAVEALTEAAKVGRVGAKAWPDPDVYAAIRDALADFRDELRKQSLECFAPAPQGLEETVVVGRRFLRVVGAVVETYGERKRQHGVVDFQDLLLGARDLLRDHAGARARLQERYRFLLIDELQDTDPVQMELIEQLCGAGLTAGKLFAVGDHKQSIYRFRGADVHLFQQLRQQVAHEGRLGLTLNFRSQPRILDFTNALLGAHLTEYEPLAAHHPQTNPEPCIEFLWSPRPDKSNVTEARMVEADWIARRIAGMIGREPLIVERQGDEQRLRPVRPGDVVLLFRAMSNVHLYEAALRQYGLHYYVVGGRAFFAQQEIYDLLNLLRALENPQDSVSLAGTLRSPFCCVSDEALFVLARAGNSSGLWAGLLDEARESLLPADQREPVRRARRQLTRWRALKDRLPIARLLGTVFADSGYDAATQLEHLGDRKLANLWKLLDLARTFDCSGLFGLAEFIDRLGDLVRAQPREEQASTQPENADVVRLMSIHQAKGLEFPVVIVPDLAATGGGGSQPVAAWDPTLGCIVRPPADEEETPPFPDFAWQLGQAHAKLEDWHEDLRTLYVACTRARDYLILSAALPSSFQPGNAWTVVLAERFDLVSGQCLAPDVAGERRPDVRVFDALRPPPGPVPSAREAAVDLPAPHLDPARVFTAQAVPGVPPRLLDLDALEDWLERQATLFAAAPAASATGIFGESGASATGVLRCVRALLAGWSWQEPDSFRTVLEHRAGAENTDDLEAAGRLLERFAGSALFRELTQAGHCQRDVEFLLRLEPDNLPALRGIVDCLWQDGSGHWHLLFFTLAGAARPMSDPVLLRRLVAAAAALRQQTGSWPEVVAYDLATDTTWRRAGGRLPQGKVLHELTQTLHAFCTNRPVPGGSDSGISQNS